MAEDGIHFFDSVNTSLAKDEISTEIRAACSGIKNYKIEAPTPGLIILTRRFIPTWAIILGVLLTITAIFGIFIFFVRSTEILTITMVDDGEKTKVSASGEGSADLRLRLSVLFQSFASR
jgi:hypothetical protein